MIELLRSVAAKWEAIPLDIKSFVISAAAGAANDLYRNRKGGEQKQRFEKAYLAGLKGLTVTLYLKGSSIKGFVNRKNTSP